MKTGILSVDQMNALTRIMSNAQRGQFSSAQDVGLLASAVETLNDAMAGDVKKERKKEERRARRRIVDAEYTERRGKPDFDDDIPF